MIPGFHWEFTWSRAIVVVCLWCQILAFEFIGQEHSADFCESETFQASCSDNEVILMRSAKYGRMEIGRCITKSYGHIGCNVDVLDVMDSFCSGRTSCKIGANHQALLKKKKLSCPKDFVAYLVTSYICVKAKRIDSCTDRSPHIITEDSGLISTSTDAASTRGDHCHVSIRPSSGRQINITMFSFLPPPPSDQPLNPSSVCYEIGMITEKDEKHTIHKCLNDPRRKNVLISSGNQIEVKVTSPQTTEISGVFLLHYKAFGCSDPKIPDKTKVLRSGTEVKVTCENSEESWTLTCKDEEWVGEMGECSSGFFSEDGWSFLGLFDHEHPYGTAIVVGIGATIGVLIGGILLYIIIAIVRRCQKPDYKNYEYADNNFTHVPVDFHGDKTDLVFNDGNNSQFGTWGPRGTMSRNHAQVPLPPVPTQNNTLSYEKPLINRNGNDCNNLL